MGLCSSAQSMGAGAKEDGADGAFSANSSGSFSPVRAVSSDGIVPQLRDEMEKPVMQTTPRREVKASLIPHVKLHKSQNIEDLYDFRDREQLGQGMTGTVIKAIHRASGQEVAVKNVRKGLVRDVEALTREIALLRQCDHPNIVRIVGSAEDKINVYMALEICKGGALLDSLMNDKKHHFSEDYVGRLAVMMFRAVEYCHRIGIAHRDLKLDNWLFESSGGELKLIDFGLSKKFYAGDFNHHGMMRMTSFLGTPGFVAPEMQQTHLGERLEYNNLVDIWSLGVIVFALLSGRMPFKRKSSDCVPLEDKENRAYRNSFSKSPWDEISKECMDFVERVLDPDPSTRPSAKEALEDPWLRKAAAKLKHKRRRESVARHGKALAAQESIALERMTQFAKTDALQKAAMMLIVHELHQDEVNDLRDIFYELDEDNDGEITWKEMKKAFLDTRVTLPEKAVHSLFDSVLGDAEHFSDNDIIPYSYFLAATMDHHVLMNTTRLREAFHAYDQDNTGKVDLGKVMDLLDDHKSKKHGSDIEMLRAQLSKRDSGSGESSVQDSHQVTFEEFCNALQTFAQATKSTFGAKLEKASSSHKKAFKIRKEVANDSIKMPSSSGGSSVSSVREIDSTNISQEINSAK